MIDELNGDFLQWLRGFFYVARTGSVRKAAQEMRRTPSTISYQIRCLEQELNVILFNRDKRAMRITEEGLKLLDWTVSTFETLQSMRSCVSNADGELKGMIHMGATLPITTLAVPAISGFIRAHPLVELTIERGLTSDIYRRIKDSEIDFGLVPFIQIPENEDLEVLFKARPLLVYPARNDWHIPPVPMHQDLKKLPYVVFYDSQGLDALNAMAQQKLVSDFILQNSVIRLNNYHLILHFIREGLGVGIMDELCFQATKYGAAWDDVRVSPLDHLLPNHLYGIATKKQKRICPQASELISCLRTYFTSLQMPDGSKPWRDLGSGRLADPLAV